MKKQEVVFYYFRQKTEKLETQNNDIFPTISLLITTAMNILARNILIGK